jgi:hypothetical protein
MVHNVALVSLGCQATLCLVTVNHNSCLVDLVQPCTQVPRYFNPLKRQVRKCTHTVTFLERLTCFPSVISRSTGKSRDTSSLRLLFRTSSALTHIYQVTPAFNSRCALQRTKIHHCCPIWRKIETGRHILGNLFLSVISCFTCNLLFYNLYKSFKPQNLFYITGVCTIHVVVNIDRSPSGLSKIDDETAVPLPISSVFGICPQNTCA